MTEEATPDAGALPTLDQLSAGWNELFPGGDTSCGDGSPWAFQVRPGSLDHVVVEFQGGGSCSSQQSCIVDKVAVSRLTLEPDMRGDTPNAGIHDHADPRNPFKDWTHLFIPYCTGDDFWGDAVQSYGGHSFYHKGAVNTLAALDWLYANVPAPSALFVTGQGAGAHASITGAAMLAHHYPNASVYQLSDSGVGVSAHLGIAPPEWNADAHFPKYLGSSATIYTISGLYLTVASRFPRMMMSEYSSAYDSRAVFDYDYYGGEGARAWSDGVQEQIVQLRAAMPRFASYIVPGWMHGILGRPEFYAASQSADPSVSEEPVRLSDWIGGLMTETYPPSIDCGSDCGGPAFGDSGANAEWDCVLSPTSPPKPQAAKVGVVFGLDEPAGVVAPGFDVKACAAGDVDCASPLDTATTDALGRASLSLPTGDTGFGGYLFVQGEPGLSSRFFFRPPVRRWWHPLLTGTRWPFASQGALQMLAGAFDVQLLTGTGVLAVVPLDCQSSITKDVAVRLDDGGVIGVVNRGRLPDGYWDPTGLTTSTGYVAYFLNVPPGDHDVTVRRGGVPIVSRTFHVAASSLTAVIGLGPGH